MLLRAQIQRSNETEGDRVLFLTLLPPTCHLLELNEANGSHHEDVMGFSSITHRSNYCSLSHASLLQLNFLKKNLSQFPSHSLIYSNLSFTLINTLKKFFTKLPMTSILFNSVAFTFLVYLISQQHLTSLFILHPSF